MSAARSPRRAGPILYVPLAVTGDHGAIWLQARRTAEQGIILKAATLQIEQPDELLPDVIGNGIGRPGGLGQGRVLVDLREVARVGDGGDLQAPGAGGKLRHRYADHQQQQDRGDDIR